MERTISQAVQRRKVLFLISLPKTPEFQDCIEDVNECLDELRQLDVDVREHIWVEDLAVANQFDVVIVVAHRDASTDELILADGNMPISNLVLSIHPDFKGVIDFSSCYSATAFAAIKGRCPECKAQVALAETTLLRRLIIYPSLIKYLYDSAIDYGTAYKEVSKAFDDALEDIEDNDVSMTHLGEQMTSVYAPKEVKRDSVFQIIVFFHYDFEKEEVLMSATSMEPNAIIRNRPQKISISLDEGDQITITLRFVTTDEDNLKVDNNEYEKTIAVRKELMIESFAVLVLPNYHANSFRAEIIMAKDEKPFVRCPFTIYIAEQENKTPADVAIEIPANDVQPSPLIEHREFVEDFSTMKRYQLKGGGPRNLKEVFSFLSENNIIPDFVDLSYLWNCIYHAYFTPLWGNDNNTFILHLMHKAKKGFSDDREWADAACKSVGIERGRLGKNPPSEKKYGAKMPDLEFKD